MRERDWDKDTKCMRVKLIDMDSHHKKELIKDQLKYEVYPHTRPACDFTQSGIETHNRSTMSATERSDKISGMSKQTWRKNYRNDLQNSISGNAFQNATKRIERIKAEKTSDRFRLRPTQRVEEYDSQHHATEKLTKKDLNTTQSDWATKGKIEASFSQSMKAMVEQRAKSAKKESQQDSPMKAEYPTPQFSEKKPTTTT